MYGQFITWLVRNLKMMKQTKFFTIFILGYRENTALNFTRKPKEAYLCECVCERESSLVFCCLAVIQSLSSR